MEACVKITTVAAVALSLAFLAGCDRGQPRPATSGASGSSAAPQSQSTPSSANSGKSERTPVQGQVDPKEPGQNKDFQTSK